MINMTWQNHTLNNSPHFKEQVISLIESALDYPLENEFEKDFYPLLTPRNYKNIHFLTDRNDQVASVVCLKQRFLLAGDVKIPVYLIGGVATDPDHRKKGLSHLLFKKIFSIYKDGACYLLWSDLTNFYQKLGFTEMGVIYQSLIRPTSQSPFEKTNIRDLKNQEMAELISLYNKSGHSVMTLQRNDLDWCELKGISSADLYIHKKDNHIINYFLVNKGADLKNIIYESFDPSSLSVPSSDFSQELTLWSPAPPKTILSQIYLGHLKIIPNDYFKCFIHSIGQGHIQVTKITDKIIHFLVDDNEYQLLHSDFLRGLFGPEYIQELSTKAIPLWISGIDSI